MTKDVNKHYDSVAANYHEKYDPSLLYDTSKKYPQNYFRLQLLISSFARKGIRRVVEVGVGEGTPLATLAKGGVDVSGFDISEAMVTQCRQTMTRNNLDPDKIFQADIMDPCSYSAILKDGQFDGLMAMGVMPHVPNVEYALDNMASLVKPGGSVFIEFRNELFSLFTCNRYTKEFICERLLAGVDDGLRAKVGEQLEDRVRMDMPSVRDKEEDGAPGYDAILSQFHNPFEVEEMFRDHGFKDINLLWYHYHPAFPWMESDDKEAFRKEAIKLEHEISGWRGYFLCSAFVVEATRG